MKMKFGLDTSCIVALLSGGHLRHTATREGYIARRRRGEQPVIPVHALLESYSVLTRSPAPLFVRAAQVREMFIENFYEVAEIPALTSKLCLETLDELAGRAIGGGFVYDAIIAQSCADAGAKVLLTWNARDFLRAAISGLEIREP